MYDIREFGGGPPRSARTPGRPGAMVRGLVLAVALGQGLGLVAPATAGYQDGLLAFDNGDYETAYREFYALAHQDHQDAQFALGQMYRFGTGVPQDDAEAFVWFRMAAENGHTEAQTVLGFLHAYGVGTNEDAFMAYFWFSLAATRSNPVAETNRDKMAQSLSADQRAEADRLVAERRQQAKALNRGTTLEPAATPPAEPEAPEPAPLEPVVSAPAPEPDPMPEPMPEPETALATPSEPASEAMPAATAVPDGFLVQLGAFREAENAPEMWDRLRRAQPELLGGLQHHVSRVDRGGSGVLHLLMVGPVADENAARALCDALDQRGIDCLVALP
jgi:cell division septation protein DedD